MVQLCVFATNTVRKMEVLGMISPQVLTCGGCNFKFTSVVVGKTQSFVDFWTAVSSYWLLAGDRLQFIAM